MRRVTLSSVASMWLSIFLSHHLTNGTIFGGKRLVNIKCFDFSLQISSKNFSLWEEMRGICSNMCIGLHVKYPLFLSYFYETWIFSIDFRKILNCPISWKSVPRGTGGVGGGVVPCGRKDRHDETNTRFSQFYEHAWKRKAIQLTNSEIVRLVRTRVQNWGLDLMITLKSSVQHCYGHTIGRLLCLSVHRIVDNRLGVSPQL